MSIALTRPKAAAPVRKARRILPGFGLSMGFSLLYLCLLILIPLAATFAKAAGIGHDHLRQILTDDRTQAAFKLGFGASFGAAAINVVAGLPVAWVLTRYRFFGRRLVDGLVDLPFALPTAVAGITLALVYGPQGWLGQFLARHGVYVANHRLGVLVALVFVTLPFVVRTLQPVMEDLEVALEEAASSLGASWGQTLRRVILPPLVPALLTGFTLAFARAVGEYGSVIFISNNIPGEGEIPAYLIVQELDNYDYAAATTISAVMLIAAFILLLAINGLQAWSRRRLGEGEA